MHSIKDFFKTIYVWLSYVLKNFPVIFIWLLGLFVFLFLDNHWYISITWDYELVWRVIVSTIAICLSSLFVTINNKSKWINRLWNSFGQVVSVLVWVGIYFVWWKYGDQEIVQYSIFICFLLLILKVFLSYRKVWKDGEDNGWYYYSTLIWHLIVGLVYGTTIMLGLFAIVKSVLYLFDISSSGLWMGDIAYFAYVIVAPFVFLSYSKFISEQYNINKFVQFFAKYVLVSLLIVYALVLLTYIGKIAITQIWPKGILIYMIYWFGAIWLATLYILYPLRDSNVNYRKRQKIYWWVLIVFLIVGILAIYIRINEYWFTAPRYIVLLLLAWFFYVGFCSLFPKYFHIQKNLFVLRGLGFLGVFARPVNMYHVVLQSQLSRRESALSDNNLLDEDNIVISWDHKNTVSTWDISKLSSVVDYVIDKYGIGVFGKYISWWVEDILVYNTWYQYDERQKMRDDVMHKIWLYYDPTYRTKIGDDTLIIDNYYGYNAWGLWEIDIDWKKVYNFMYSYPGWSKYNDPNYNSTTDIFSIKIKNNLTCKVKLQEITSATTGKSALSVEQSWEPIKIQGDSCTLRINSISLEKISEGSYTIQYMNWLAYIR